MENTKKSISNLLDKRYSHHLNHRSGKRGRILHYARTRYLKSIFKNSNRWDRTNIRNFSEKLTKTKVDILSEILKNPDYQIYHADVKILLNSLLMDIRGVAKELARKKYGIVIVEEIEKLYFKGEVSLEVDAIEKIGGINVSARSDCVIECDQDTFIVRDFKSYERDKEDDPMNPKSQYHRDFMQTCLYAIIFEKARNQTCTAIQLEYFPNKVVEYDFTGELRESARKFALDTAFEGFEGIRLDNGSRHDINEEEVVPIGDDILSTEAPIKDKEFFNASKNENGYGFINTIKGKPLELIMGQDNKMEGYLYPNKAHVVKDGHNVIVEKEDGVRIMCVVKKIECSQDTYPGQTSSHMEENYRIILIPVGQFTPEGFLPLTPQTIISGQIKQPTSLEFYMFKNLPQNGMPIGKIEALGDEMHYPLDVNVLFQSLFIAGVQGTGKTSAIKYLVQKITQNDKAPALILFDAEEDYVDVDSIPTNDASTKIMETENIKKIAPKNINIIKFEGTNNHSITLKAVDPLDLPLFLHDLASKTFEALERIIEDIKAVDLTREFAFPELRCLILERLERDEYDWIHSSTKSAIERGLMAVSLDLFDQPNATPLNIESMLRPGKVTVIDCFELREKQQRIIALYFLAALYKYQLKRSKREMNSGVLFILDELQRVVPKTLKSEYQKKIIDFFHGIVHRGRKRKYGVAFATQSPLDIKAEIIDLCNTKIFFQVQGSAVENLKQYLSKEEREQLKRLPVGQAFITSKGKHKPVIIKFPFIN